jgi:putative ABC transport system substrate-binding protein
VKRREFITLLGGAAAAWPLAVRAQQPSMPVVGFLGATSPDINANRLRLFRQGLKDTGHVEGENVTIEYRWAENQMDRLPMLAAELAQRRVAVIATIGNTPLALAAKAATTTIPIVFAVGEDPVRLGLVASLARPGGNLTGINFFNAELAAKRLGLLRELVPTAKRVAALVNPTDAMRTETTVRDVLEAARAMGLEIQLLNASTNDSALRDVETAATGLQVLPFEAATGREIDAAFESIAREKVDALFVAGGAFYAARRVQLVVLAVRYAVATTFSQRTFVEAGGLMSYGTNLADTCRQVGQYTARILKGANPADLPVMQPSKFELLINLNTARALRFEVPPTLLARADEVIE